MADDIFLVPPTVRRLVALLTAGYRIREQDLGDADNCISLEHVAPWQRVKEKSLYLYDDGSVMGGPRVDNTCLLIKPNDIAEFQLLVDAAPKPTWWDLNHGPFYLVWVWTILLAALLGVFKLAQFVWHLIFAN